MMNDIRRADLPGVAAIVSYLPEPLASYLSHLRQSLPGEHNPQAHITILPPRVLPVPVEEAALQGQEVLRQFHMFAVGLASVRAFPETNVLYIDLDEGGAGIHDLHEALNTGSLAAAEEFDFRPHLTISGPMPESELPRARRMAEKAWRAAQVPRRFLLGEVAFLWRGASQNGDWTRLWSQALDPAPKASAVTAQTY